MKLYESMDASSVVLNLEGKSSTQIIQNLIHQLHRSGAVFDADEAIEKVLEREALGGTGIGSGVAFPHARIDSAEKILVALAITKEGIDFEAMDGQPARLIFLVLAPEREAENYLKVMASISKLMTKEEVRDELLHCSHESEVIRTIERYES